MKTFVAYRLEMQPRHGQTSRECLAAVRDEIVEWVRGIFRGLGVHDLQLAFDGSSLEPYPGHTLATELDSCATHQIVTVDWVFPDAQTPVIWHFYTLAACDARGVEVAMAVQADWQAFLLRPVQTVLVPANPFHTIELLRGKLMEGWKCQVDGQPAPNRARLLRKNQVESFVRDTLLNPKRVLPVILFALDDRFKMDLDSLHHIQRCFGGLGHVAVLLDQLAADRLAKVVDPKAFSKDAVVRIYWPGLLQKGFIQNDTYWTLEQYTNNLKARPLINELLNRVTPVAGEQLLRPGPVLQGAKEALERASAEGPRIDPSAAARLAEAEAELLKSRQAQQNLQRDAQASQRRVEALLDELAELRAQLAVFRAAPPTVSVDDKLEELTSELERSWDENARLRTDGEAVRRQLTELEMDFRTYLDSSALFSEDAEPVDASIPPDAAVVRSFAAVADALRGAADEFADILVVWEDAEQSAEQSLFGSPSKVFQALEAVAEVGRAYFKARNGGPPLGPVDRAFNSRVPFKYTGFESPTTRSLFGAERVFHHRGQTRRMERHLTLGGGQTNNCLQIYFDFDDPAGRVLIGYCGRHLPFASQRT
jgi:hypothetical protein